MVSPSTTFNTSAVGATGSAETVGGETYAMTAKATMDTTATRTRIADNVTSRRRTRRCHDPHHPNRLGRPDRLRLGSCKTQAPSPKPIDGTTHGDQTGSRRASRHPRHRARRRAGDLIDRSDPLARRRRRIETLSRADID